MRHARILGSLALACAVAIAGHGLARAAPAAARPIAFTRLASNIERGTPWAVVSGGLLCVPAGRQNWDSGRTGDMGARYENIFHGVMSGAGFPVEGDTGNLFESGAAKSEYAVAGAITYINAKLCYPYSAAGNLDNVKGHLDLGVEWQIYSLAERKVIAEVDTIASYDLDKSAADGLRLMMDGAFAQTVRQLINQGALRKAVFEQPTSPPNARVIQPILPAIGPTLPFTAPRAGEAADSVSDTIPGVVVILTDDGQGSGFLFSSDGYVLTNAHVVEDARYVKVRWGDGGEGLGEVIKSSKARDVALVKVDARGRRPLAMALGNVSPKLGDNVYAIGAPLDLKFQNTVTRGVFSASRLYDGLKFIQSDASINPGNSGGPLLNEHAQVIGVTVSTFRVGDAPTGLNLFIPIQDALDFLKLEPAPTFAPPKVIAPPVTTAVRSPSRPARAK